MSPIEAVSLEVHLLVGVGDERAGGDGAEVDEGDGPDPFRFEVEDALEHGARVQHLPAVGVDAHQQGVDPLVLRPLDHAGEVAVGEPVDDVVDLHVADGAVVRRVGDRPGGVRRAYGGEEQAARETTPPSAPARAWRRVSQE